MKICGPQSHTRARRKHSNTVLCEKMSLHKICPITLTCHPAWAKQKQYKTWRQTCQNFREKQPPNTVAPNENRRQTEMLFLKEFDRCVVARFIVILDVLSAPCVYVCMCVCLCVRTHIYTWVWTQGLCVLSTLYHWTTPQLSFKAKQQWSEMYLTFCILEQNLAGEA